MMFEDKYGQLFMPDEVDELLGWELDDLEIHVAADRRSRHACC